MNSSRRPFLFAAKNHSQLLNGTLNSSRSNSAVRSSALLTASLYSSSKAEKDKKEQKPKKILKVPKREDFIKRIDFEDEIIDSNIRNFRADLVGGNLILLPGKPGQASIKIQWQKDKEQDQSLMPVFSLKNDTLCLESHSLIPFLSQKDAYVMEVTLPDDVDISVKMFGGTLFLDNMKGKNLDVQMRAGTISGVSYAKSVKASITAGGDINLHHLQGSAEISIGAGDLRVLFDRVRQKDVINLTCRMGDIHARFPQGFLSHDTVIKKSGEIANEVGAKVKTHNWLGGVKIDMEDVTEELHKTLSLY